jgi:hypothetical protein
MRGIIWGDTLASFNLLMHLLFGVMVLGASTHHLFQVIKGRAVTPARPAKRYAFWTCVGYLVTFGWGVVIYPTYAYHVRYLFSDEHTPWATALFEIKEHILAVGLGILPFYYLASRDAALLAPRQRTLYLLSVWTIAAIVWYSFVVGGILVNVKGLWV